MTRVSVVNKDIYQVDVNAIFVQRKETGEEAIFLHVKAQIWQETGVRYFCSEASIFSSI